MKNTLLWSANNYIEQLIKKNTIKCHKNKGKIKVGKVKVLSRKTKAVKCINRQPARW